MKKTFLFVTSILILLSCENEESILSCDPVVNNFVVKNLNELKELDRASLCQYQEEVQKATYRTLSPEKRYELWLNKLEEVFCYFDFNEIENEHVYNLLKHIDINLFDEAYVSKLTKGDSMEYAKQWILYGREILMWPTEKIAFIVSSLEVDYDKYLQERMAITGLEKAAITSSEGSCNCSTNNSFCSNSMTCNSGSCGTSDTGCGWLWMDSCNGSCSY